MKNQKQAYNSNSEKWKYTNIEQFASHHFHFKTIDKKINLKCEKNEILLYNGKFYKMGENLMNSKIIACNMNDAIKRNSNNLKKIFNTTDKNIDFYLHIPDNPIETISITNIIEQKDTDKILATGNFIYIEKNSNAKIIYREKSKEPSYISNIFEIYMQDNAKLEFANITNKGDNSRGVHDYKASLNANAQLTYHAIDISGKIIKNNYCINLNKPGSSCFFNGFNIAKKKNHNDNYIEIHHNAKHTISNLNYHIVSKDSARSVLFAKAIIKKDSSSCEAYQNNKNIILSKSAIVHSNPQLEIYNDDVKCSHGSTTGQIDDDAIYYMRTRGINQNDAKKLILHSFLNDIIKQVSIDNLRLDLNNKIEQYLNNVN